MILFKFQVCKVGRSTAKIALGDGFDENAMKAEASSRDGSMRNMQQRTRVTLQSQSMSTRFFDYFDNKYTVVPCKGIQ